eukprot:109926-Chlamydomonas_euryale.AAC.1
MGKERGERARPGVPGYGRSGSAAARPGVPGYGRSGSVAARPGVPGYGRSGSAAAQPGMPGCGSRKPAVAHAACRVARYVLTWGLRHTVRTNTWHVAYSTYEYVARRIQYVRIRGTSHT